MEKLGTAKIKVNNDEMNSITLSDPVSFFAFLEAQKNDEQTQEIDYGIDMTTSHRSYEFKILDLSNNAEIGEVNVDVENEKEIYLEHIFIDANCRRAGIGSKVFEYICRYYKESGFTLITGVVEDGPEFDLRVKFYKKHNCDIKVNEKGETILIRKL